MDLSKKTRQPQLYPSFLKIRKYSDCFRFRSRSREQTPFYIRYIRCTCDFTRRWYTMSWPLAIKCHDQEDNTKNISVTEFDKALRTYNFPRKTKHLSPVTRTVTTCHHLSFAYACGDAYLRDGIHFYNFYGSRDVNRFGSIWLVRYRLLQLYFHYSH